MSAFSITTYTKGILRNKGFTVADYPFTEDETQKTLRAVIDSFKIVDGFVATKDDSFDCFIEVQLPQYCTTANGKDRILIDVDMEAILKDRAAAIAQDGGTEK